MFGNLVISPLFNGDIEKAREKFYNTIFADDESIILEYKERLDDAFLSMLLSYLPFGMNEPCLVDVFEEVMSIYTDYDDCGESKYTEILDTNAMVIDGVPYYVVCFKYNMYYYNQIKDYPPYKKMIIYDTSESMLDVYYDSKCEAINTFIEELEDLDLDIDGYDIYAAFDEIDTRAYFVSFRFSDSFEETDLSMSYLINGTND